MKTINLYESGFLQGEGIDKNHKFQPIQLFSVRFFGSSIERLQLPLLKDYNSRKLKH